MFPGAGHLYLGLYQRAAIFFGVFFATIAFVSNARGGEMLGLFIPFWVIFGIIDAVRQAHAINMTGVPESNIVKPEIASGTGYLFLGVIMILIGGFFTLRRFFDIDLTFLWDYAPLFIVAFGIWLVFSYYKEKQKKAEANGESTGSSTI